MAPGGSRERIDETAHADQWREDTEEASISTCLMAGHILMNSQGIRPFGPEETIRA